MYHWPVHYRPSCHCIVSTAVMLHNHYHKRYQHSCQPCCHNESSHSNPVPSVIRPPSPEVRSGVTQPLLSLHCPICPAAGTNAVRCHLTSPATTATALSPVLSPVLTPRCHLSCHQPCYHNCHRTVSSSVTAALSLHQSPCCHALSPVLLRQLSSHQSPCCHALSPVLSPRCHYTNHQAVISADTHLL